MLTTPASKIKRAAQGLDDMGHCFGKLWVKIGLDVALCDSHLGAGTRIHRETGERGGMDTIAELERRIAAALMRIGDGIETLSAAPAAVVSDAPVATLADGVAEAEIARLNEALDEERMVSSQLQERLRALRDKASPETLALQAEVARLTKLLDVQGLEVQRMKKTVGSLREQLRVMTDAQADGRVEPHLINKAMLTELEALRALRAADAAELDELIAALEPLAAAKEEVSQDA